MNHEYYIQLALDLAKRGWPDVAPNPMVGCVIVKNDEVVASGYHQKFGEAHAEVNAVANLPEHISPADCTVYVTLEPCSHFGKTPPCADLLISKGFKSVVVACTDPNPLVAGFGIKKMRDGGIDVIVGVAEKEARELNKRFISFYENKRPYFILKWAQTADGFISRTPLPGALNRERISGPETNKIVRRLRAEVMGIMVGKNTVLNDNCLLTTRLVDGKNPARIFIDKNLEVPLTFNIYNGDAETIVFNAVKNEQRDRIRFIKINFNENVLQQISEKLYVLNIQNVLVEGGKFLLDDFINQHLWDEVLVFQNPHLAFDQGVRAPAFALKNSFELAGNDKFYHHFKNETLPAKGLLAKEIF
jgi:diaminohydroxyphosphoribosylaminopyrimidine deaminase / 5-amino-6-(5-phosphoribosylamino)uracil reductase